MNSFAQPIWPLAEFLGFIYMASPYEDPHELFAELPFPIELKGSIQYENLDCVEPYKSELLDFIRAVKGQFKPDLPDIYDVSGNKLDFFQALHLFFKQIFIEKELFFLNARFCASEHCMLCCEGPSQSSQKIFWEIPLADAETSSFDCPGYASEESLKKTSEDGLLIDNIPFYELQKPAIIHWSSGPSLILPKGVRCPNLKANGRCEKYETRPYTCRKPQVFSYILDTSPLSPSGKLKNSFVARDSLLAVWDCPYVKRLKDDMAQYASLCDTEIIFIENK